MKKYKAPYFSIIALIAAVAAALLCGIAASLQGNTAASAAADPAYKFEVSHYDVTYDINKNCSIAVTEDITISYKGYASTGFLRDIPVNGGIEIRNVNVAKLVNGKTEPVFYDVYFEDTNYLTVDIGDSSNKTGKSESYRITYFYNITNSAVNKGMLPLNPIGTGWECTLRDCSVTLLAPEGYKGAVCYKGRAGSTAKYEFTDNEKTEDGKTILRAYAEVLGEYQGITFDLSFESGAVKSYFNFTPYWFVIGGLAILALAVILKLFIFNKTALTPVVNFEAPEHMDPLLMGVLIDGVIDNEDITSLIYYFADKGYLKINLDDKNNPTLIRVVQNLPDSAENYEKTMFYSLFANGEVVQTKSLADSFYRTVDKVTAMATAKIKGLYKKSSVTAALVFAALAGVLLGIAPLILAFFGISSKLLTAIAFIAVVPCIVVSLIGQSIITRKHKTAKSKLAGIAGIMAAVSIIAGAAYVFLVPSAIIGIVPKILLCITSAAIAAISSTLINRTEEYTRKLNDILGFRNFILLAEKDRLEKMLEDNPQFYYHVLPYAQVLGVSDKWEEKFADLTVQPPAWATGSMLNTVIEFHIINSILRSTMRNVSSNMVSRPASSGINGGGRGGFGGGFSGGGFGGGGGRGR